MDTKFGIKSFPFVSFVRFLVMTLLGFTYEVSIRFECTQRRQDFRAKKADGSHEIGFFDRADVEFS